MNVALYIYDFERTNEASLTVDTDFFTVDNTVLTADLTIVGGFGSNFVAKRIELYNDENISITSSVQDIKDISKVRTDYSQSFTIPASPRNNSIFRHWYESSIDGGFDQRVKYQGFIEIDTVPFKFGGFALNSAQIKDNRIENYNITFYGDAKNIKDLIKEDKLNSLDFSDLNHDFNSDEVIDRINGTIDDGLCYPLFAHDRLYDYGNASPDDVTTNTGAIQWNSLFPSVSVPNIMSRIESKYGITFTGAFLDYTQFSNLWMLFKNAQSLTVPTLNQQVNFITKDSELTDIAVNLTDDTIGLAFQQQKISLTVVPNDHTIYSVIIYKNGQPFLIYSDRTGTTENLIFSGVRNTQNQNDRYTVMISSEVPFTYQSILFYTRLSPTLGIFTAESGAQTTESIIDIVRYAPDIKIMDFLAGLIKAFSLTIIPASETEFELIPLELYYNNGKTNDITSSIITESIEVKKTSMYKNINFMFEKSSNILNDQFSQLFSSQRGYDYGDLKYEQIDSLESNTFEVRLPFENPMYERKTASEFLTVTFKDKDLNNYVPKPVIMYRNGDHELTTDIRIAKESGFEDIGSYIRFSNEIDNGGLMTLNWGEEVSPWVLDVAPQGLYARHYSNYIGNVFSLKGRLIKAKAYLNPIQLNKLELNDRIVIRDNRYTINTMTTNLTNGEVDFELLTDYRTVGEITIGTRFAMQDVYQVDNTSQEIEVYLLIPGMELVASDVDWITYDLGVITESQILVVTLDSNKTGERRTGNIIIEFEDDIITIPVIQEANLNFSNTTITFDNTNITFDNDGTGNN